MKQTRTRILSLLLALVMCLGLLPVTALAADIGEPSLFLEPNQEGRSSTAGYAGPVFTCGVENQPGTHSQITYTVKFFLQADGKKTLISEETCKEGNRISGSYADKSGIYGYRILSITGQDSGTTSSNGTAGFSFIPTSDVEVVFESYRLDKTFTITYVLNGAGQDIGVSVKNGAQATPPSPPSLPGYKFLGWYIGEVKGQYLTNYSSVSNAFVVGRDLTIYAMWEKDAASNYTITFDPNGGTCDVKTLPLVDWMLKGPLPTPTRPGFTFEGWYRWYKSPSDPGHKIEAGETFSAPETVTAVWSKATDTFTVTFDLNGVPGKVPEPQKVAKGKTVTLPVLKSPNAEFLGWGYSTDGKTLIEWKTEYTVTSDLTLYAMWGGSDEDTYDFKNNDRAFSTYKITDTYFDFLTEDLDTTWKSYMTETFIERQGEPVEWHGSCFGMSAVYSMARGGAIDLSVFQRGTSTLRGLKTPRQSQNIQDLINFYMMAQSTIASNHAKSIYLRLEQTERYQKIVSDLMTEKGFSVLGFNYIRGGHAIVARGVKRSDDGYHIEIWDPNNPEGLGDLVISSDYSNARFSSETYNAGEYNVWTVIKYIMPLSTRRQTYDAKNLQSVFGKSKNMSTHSSSSNLYQFSSSTGDFILTTSDGRSAAVKNGTQVSGDLKLLDNTIDGGPNSDYRFSVEASGLDRLTVTLSGEGPAFTFVSDTILARAAADTLRSIVIDGDTVTTTCATSADQEITVVSDKLGNTWNKVTVSGKDTGFTLSTESGQLKVSSKSNAAVTVQGENVNTRKTSGKQTITASSSGTAVAMNSLDTGTQQPAENGPFTDVKKGTYYYDAVLWAVEKKITSGTSATTFSPNNPCTRGQIVTFLWRAAGSPKPTSSINPFADVKESAYYYDAVLWAVEKGITSGTSATTFSPDTACTRGQTVTFLWRAAGSPKATSSNNPFADVQSGAYYYDAVLWAVEKGITSGTSATTFAPGTTVTRGQTVTFLYRNQGGK